MVQAKAIVFSSEKWKVIIFVIYLMSLDCCIWLLTQSVSQFQEFMNAHFLL